MTKIFLDIRFHTLSTVHDVIRHVDGHKEQTWNAGQFESYPSLGMNHPVMQGLRHMFDNNRVMAGLLSLEEEITEQMTEFLA